MSVGKNEDCDLTKVLHSYHQSKVSEKSTPDPPDYEYMNEVLEGSSPNPACGCLNQVLEESSPNPPNGCSTLNKRGTKFKSPEESLDNDKGNMKTNAPWA